MKTNCSYCGKRFKMDEAICFCPEHKDSKARPDKLTKKQNIQVLKNLREYILKHDLYYEDCDDIGNKYTVCNWGICNDSAEVWNKPEYHIWPYEFKTEGRVAPIDRAIKCHFDSRDKLEHFGCFYNCMIFKHNLEPTREQTLQMIDAIIKGEINESM